MYQHQVEPNGYVAFFLETFLVEVVIRISRTSFFNALQISLPWTWGLRWIARPVLNTAFPRKHKITNVHQLNVYSTCSVLFCLSIQSLKPNGDAATTIGVPSKAKQCTMLVDRFHQGKIDLYSFLCCAYKVFLWNTRLSTQRTQRIEYSAMGVSLKSAVHQTPLRFSHSHRISVLKRFSNRNRNRLSWSHVAVTYWKAKGAHSSSDGKQQPKQQHIECTGWNVE